MRGEILAPHFLRLLLMSPENVAKLTVA